jgi:large subunit ribosomal protein L18
MTTTRKAARQRIHERIRKKMSGTAECPRLVVHFSGRHVYAQAIDDSVGRTLAAASTAEPSLRSKKTTANRAAAEQVGKTIAERLLEKKLDHVVFDRGGFLYHGKAKALADAARASGLKF